MILTLRKYCIYDFLRSVFLFTLAFLSLIALALVAPAISKGAPITIVLESLIRYQLLLAFSIAFPFGLSTAVFSFWGRFKQSGELETLYSCGISNLKIFKLLLPIVLLLSIVSYFFYHLVMPNQMLNIRINAMKILQQSLSTRVAKKRPIHYDKAKNQFLVANGANNQDLHDFFMYKNKDGVIDIIYSPKTSWTVQDGMYLNLHNARSMQVSTDEVTTVSIPLFNYNLKLMKRNNTHTKPDVMTMEKLKKHEILYQERINKNFSKYYNKKLRYIQQEIHNRWMLAFFPLFSLIIITGFSMILPAISPTVSTFLAIPYTAFLLFIPKMIIKGPGAEMPFNTAWVIWGEVFLLLTISSFLFYRKNK